jgi:hypothetical protein
MDHYILPPPSFTTLAPSADVQSRMEFSHACCEKTMFFANIDGLAKEPLKIGRLSPSLTRTLDKADNISPVAEFGLCNLPGYPPSRLGESVPKLNLTRILALGNPHLLSFPLSFWQIFLRASYLVTPSTCLTVPLSGNGIFHRGNRTKSLVMVVTPVRKGG